MENQKLTNRHSPLDGVHRSRGAKMTSFGGWEMPLSYPTGTIAEHMACRNGAVVFDVSHMGSIRVTGATAFDLLQRTFTNDLGRIAPGRAQYTHLLDPDDASVVDDVIIAWMMPDTFEVIANASNTSVVFSAIMEGLSSEGDVQVEDITTTRAMLAIQGPSARRLVSNLVPEIGDLKRFEVGLFEWQGMPGLVTATGYTGEEGFECSVPIADAESFFDAVTTAGIEPAGLGARDTLRLEAGLPLHGHELGPGITPLQAGLGWVVSWDKGDFRGRDALVRERDSGPDRKLCGIVTHGRRPLRGGQDVIATDKIIGTTTSGNYSPVLDRGIAIAFLRPSVDVGDSVEVDVRGTRVPGVVSQMPFVGRS